MVRHSTSPVFSEGFWGEKLVRRLWWRSNKKKCEKKKRGVDGSTFQWFPLQSITKKGPPYARSCIRQEATKLRGSKIDMTQARGKTRYRFANRNQRKPLIIGRMESRSEKKPPYPKAGKGGGGGFKPASEAMKDSFFKHEKRVSDNMRDRLAAELQSSSGRTVKGKRTPAP